MKNCWLLAQAEASYMCQVVKHVLSLHHLYKLYCTNYIESHISPVLIRYFHSFITTQIVSNLLHILSGYYETRFHINKTSQDSQELSIHMVQTSSYRLRFIYKEFSFKNKLTAARLANSR